MRLIQILLPLTTANAAGKLQFEAVLETLTNEFGGATAFVNSPAKGVWDDEGERQHDRIVTIEAMVERLDTEWWSAYRRHLEATFDQDEIVIRAIEMIKV